MNNEQYLDDLGQELKKYTHQLSAIQKYFKGNAGADIEKISESLQDILQEAGSSYAKLQSASAAEWEPIKDITAQAFEKLRNSFNEFLNLSSEQIKEYTSKLGENSEKQPIFAVEYIKRNPFTTIFVAGSLGFIIGKILR